jgi:hypothetical protein
MEEASAEEVKAVPAEVPASEPVKPSTPVNRLIPTDLTAMKLLNVTKSFVVVRALVYAVVTAVMFVGGLLALGLIWGIATMFKGSDSTVAPVVMFVVVLATLGAFWGFLRFAKGYCLYMVKAAHVAAITEYLRTGAVPVTENGYQGVLAFGKEKVGKHFGAANIAFVCDKFVAAATRQIMRWVNKAQNLLSFVPGSKNVFAVVNFILSTALNFMDEAVLSYIFYHEEEKSSFKKACDGLVYYAQAWKGMIMGAAKVAVFVWCLRIICFVICYAIIGGAVMFLTRGGNIGFIVAVIFASVLTYGLQTILIEPYATCMMIKDYHRAIAGQTLKADMYGTLCKVSSGFKNLFDKSKSQPAPVPAEAAPTPVEAV